MQHVLLLKKVLLLVVVLLYIRAQESVDKLKLEGDEKFGAQIVARALEEPLRIIASNAGYEASVIVNRVKSEKGNIGFDAKRRIC